MTPNTPTEKINELFQLQTNTESKLKKTDYKKRIIKLNRIKAFITDPEKRKLIVQALQADLRKPEAEALGSEISIIISEINNFNRYLRRWLKPKKVSTPLPFMGASSYIHYESKGCSLIIAPWNYPFQLAIAPLCYAIAAGNPAIIKPSEYAFHTSQLLADMLSELFSEDEVAVVQGGIPESQELLSLPFRHIFFTGSPAVGKIVMKAAAQHLASVTLELGGKSPCIIDESAPIKKTVESIAWGKCYNAGQTCIAPDYLLVHESVQKEIVDQLKDQWVNNYDPQGMGIIVSEDFGRIISEKHYRRTLDLLDDAIAKGGEILFGGEYNDQQKYISPTLIGHVSKDMKIMQEEIFAPLLPILTFRKKEEVPQQIAQLERPLSLYIFCKNQEHERYYLKNTIAGGTVINDTLIHFANQELPFGGINHSGTGRAHGQTGLYAFMNERGVMKQHFGFTHLLHPPYTKATNRILELLNKVL